MPVSGAESRRVCDQWGYPVYILYERSVRYIPLFPYLHFLGCLWGTCILVYVLICVLVCATKHLCALVYLYGLTIKDRAWVSIKTKNLTAQKKLILRMSGVTLQHCGMSLDLRASLNVLTDFFMIYQNKKDFF